MMKSCIRKSLGASVLIFCLIGGVMAQQRAHQDGRNDQDDRGRGAQAQAPRNQGGEQAPPPVDQGRQQAQQANARDPPPAPAQPQRPADPNRPVAGGPSQEKDDGQPHIINYPQCKEDIAKHCNREDINLQSDMAVLECLQDAAQIEAEALSSPCEHLVWEFKVNLTSDARFQRAAEEFCKEEMISVPAMGKCSSESKSGYLLSCLLESITLIPKESRCYKFLFRTERLAFSDFRLVGPFVRACGNLVQKFECGSLNPPDAASKTPHSQGATLECMIQKIIESSKKAKDAMQDIDTECRHEIMRIAELQSEDFHLDRPLFFACRSDREVFCKGVQSGEGRIFECLMQHRNDQQMTANCTQVLGERAQLMGQNYRLSHPLLDGCKNELKAHGCAPQGAEAAEHFHLSWVLLCLENAAHSSSQQFGDSCKHEMITHRQMMMSEHRLSPEIVLTCAQDIDRFCSKEGLLIENMGTIHCLMKKASERVRKESDALQSQCLQAINTIVKIADIGSNYKVDKVLYASCRNLIDGKCSRDAGSESETLTCLMKHLDDHDMTDQCEQRLLEIQYFMARDWTLDPELYRACHADAVAKCKAFDNWHQQANDKKIPDPGPQVLACLYRSAYDEQEPLQRDCAKHVRRVLRTRAVRVQLIPEIEESCRDALSEFCSTKTAAGEEMQCLQDNFETEDFQSRYKQCYAELKKFTEYESKDVKLNRALSKACRPVIDVHCNEFMNEEIDNGDVMECLLENKQAQEMSAKCRSYVNHFELISLRDYNFNPKFKQACAKDIENHCNDHQHRQDQAAVVRCLSQVMFEHRVLGDTPELSKDCRKQLKLAYLEQEQFDDKDKMDAVDPMLFKSCQSELDKLGCKSEKTFEDMVECLRSQPEFLGPECKGAIFEREKFQAADNELDDELQQSCKSQIKNYCEGYEKDRVLECLTMTKIARTLTGKCRKVVMERMKEAVKDVRLQPGLLHACEAEIKRFCPEEEKKIRSPQYAKHQLEGVVVGCLRLNYAPKDPSKRAHYGHDCEHEVTRLILEGEFDPELDPGFYKACKSLIPKHCSKEIISTDGSFNSVMDCLKADYYAGAITDQACASELARRTQESLVDIHLDPLLHEACGMDIKNLCGDITPGSGRLIACLVDAVESTSARMTKSCRTQMTERKKLWQKANKDFGIVMPGNVLGLIGLVAESPARDAFLTLFTMFVVLLFVIGCCCGRVTKRVARELKNK